MGGTLDSLSQAEHIKEFGQAHGVGVDWVLDEDVKIVPGDERQPSRLTDSSSVVSSLKKPVLGRTEPGR